MEGSSKQSQNPRYGGDFRFWDSWAEESEGVSRRAPDAAILVDHWLQFPDGGAIGRLRVAAPDALVVLISAMPLNQLRRRG
jgi:hypothetical protein